MSNKRNNCAEVISPDNKIYPCNLLKMSYLFAKGRWQHLQPLINYVQINFFQQRMRHPKQVSFESHWKTLGYPAPGDSKFSQVRSILSDCRLGLSGTATIDTTEKCIQQSRGLVPSSPLMHGFGRSLRGYLMGCIISREQSPASHTWHSCKGMGPNERLLTSRTLLDLLEDVCSAPLYIWESISLYAGWPWNHNNPPALA